MSKRALYLVAYDIRHPRRLAKALKVVKAYATGGQKSVHECFLSPREKAELRQELGNVIRRSEDSVVFVRLDPRSRPRTLGIALPPRDETFFYIG